jgi:hypothetical protein
MPRTPTTTDSPQDATERRTGHTMPSPGDAASGEDLALPHERDQSDDTSLGDGTSPKVIRQAARDLEAGLVDTDLRGTPNAGSEQRDELLRREAERTAGAPTSASGLPADAAPPSRRRGSR